MESAKYCGRTVAAFLFSSPTSGASSVRDRAPRGGEKLRDLKLHRLRDVGAVFLVRRDAQHLQVVVLRGGLRGLQRLAAEAVVEIDERDLGDVGVAPPRC